MSSNAKPGGVGAAQQQKQTERNAMLNVIRKAKNRLTDVRTGTTPSSSSVTTPASAVASGFGTAQDYSASAASAGALIAQPMLQGHTLIDPSEFLTPEDMERQQQSRVRTTTYVSVRDNRGNFIDTWTQRIEQFVKNEAETTLELPAELSGFDRKELHTLAAKFNLHHGSRGIGRERRLVLHKDTFFAQTEGEQRPSEATLEELKKMPFQRRMERHERSKAQAAQYADKNVEKSYHKFRDVINPNAQAVDTAASLEELLMAQQQRAAAGDSSSATTTTAVGRQQQQQRGKGTGAVSSLWSAVLSGSDNNAASAVATTSSSHKQPQQPQKPLSYIEECTVCRTRNVLDYDVRSWECNGYCEKCNKDSIWTLEREDQQQREEIEVEDEVAVDKRNEKRGRAGREGEEEEGEDRRTLGHRKGILGSRSADKEEEEEDEDDYQGGDVEEEITPEMAVGLARDAYEMNSDDVAFIQHFSQQHKTDLSKHFTFSNDFAELVCPKPATATPTTTNVHFLLTTHRASSGVPVSKLVKALQQSVASSSGALSDIFVALPALIVEGDEMQCVVRLACSSAEEATRLGSLVQSKLVGMFGEGCCKAGRSLKHLVK